MQRMSTNHLRPFCHLESRFPSLASAYRQAGKGTSPSVVLLVRHRLPITSRSYTRGCGGIVRVVATHDITVGKQPQVAGQTSSSLAAQYIRIHTPISTMARVEVTSPNHFLECISAVWLLKTQPGVLRARLGVQLTLCRRNKTRRSRTCFPR
jgi:hypothetical protein